MLDGGEPKYLNSPETPVFHKGQALYGLFEARQRPGRPERIVVVEGYLDVISLAQFGVEPAVATLGTATTSEHVRRLTRLTDQVIFCFDGDRAGRAAAWRALETALPFGGGTVELKFLLLPEGEDPDSLVRRDGADEFSALLDDATPLSRFLVDSLGREIDIGAADGRARLVTNARPLLARLPDGPYRRFLIADLAAFADMTEKHLEMALDAAPQHPERARSASISVPAERSTPVRKAILLVLHYPSAAALLRPVEGLADVDQPGVALLLELIEIARLNPQITTAGLIERLRDDAQGRYLDRLAAIEPLDGEEAAPAVIQGSMERIVDRYRRRQAAEAVKNRRPLGPG